MEGIGVTVELSHPRVVKATLGRYNQTLELEAQGSGETNVIVYLTNQPEVIDVFRVRVSSVVNPPSPVHLHLGGDIQYKIMDNFNLMEGSDSAVHHHHQPQQLAAIHDSRWTSERPDIFRINSQTGRGLALGEGKVYVSLNNHINAASSVHVSKVKYAELDQSYRKSLMINVDEQQQKSYFSSSGI